MEANFSDRNMKHGSLITKIQNVPSQFVWVCLLSLPHILGAASDFPEKKTPESRALEAEAASENKERREREHQEPTENNKRKPRQSFSFTTFPFQGEFKSCKYFQNLNEC